MQGLDYIIPHSSDQPYDMLNVIRAVIDERNFFEIMPDYAKNIIVGFARMNGQTVGVIANQPNSKAGVCDVHACLCICAHVNACVSACVHVCVTLCAHICELVCLYPRLST